VSAFLDPASRSDWLAVNLEANKIYKFTLSSPVGGTDSMLIVKDYVIQNTVKFTTDNNSFYFNASESFKGYVVIQGNTAQQGKAYQVKVEEVKVTEQAGYQVEFDLDPALQPYKNLFDLAAQEIQRVVKADLPAVASATKSGFVDDLYIKVKVDNSISGTLLGYAGPEGYRTGSNLPSEGDFFTTPAVLSRLNTSQAVDFIVHETMHAMGVGTLWQSFGLLNAGGNYIGAQALAAYRQLSNNPTAKFVPTDPGSGHFSETVFGNEISTPILGRNADISAITVGALADLGYVVDFAAADNYVLPVGVSTV